MTRPAERILGFVDREEARQRLVDAFGADRVVCISRMPLPPPVRRLTREGRAGLYDEIESMHRDRPFGGIVYWQEHYVIAATELAERLGLPKRVDDPRVVRDKLRMKEALRGRVDCAVGTPLTTLDDARNADVRFPGVLKPRWGFASICAVRADDRDALVRELSEKRDKLLTTRIDEVDVCVPAKPEFLFEPFVGGTEHTVEGFVWDGEPVFQILSDKLPMVPPYFVETGDVMPSRLPEAARTKILAVAREAGRALGIRSGWTHTEIKLWDGTPWVMEVGARMGGGYTRDLVGDVYGLDMMGMLLDLCAGRMDRPPALPPARRTVVARRLQIRRLALVVGVEGLREAQKDPHFRIVARESTRRRFGAFLGIPYSYEGTLLAYFVSGDGDEALERSEAFSRRLRRRGFEIETVPPSFYRSYLRVKRMLLPLLSRT